MDTLEARLQKRIHASLYALLFLTVLLGLSVLLEGCTDNCEVTHEYKVYNPVYTSLDEIRSSVAVIDPVPLSQTGKIYYKDGYLFVNQPGEGIHIIDNQDPSHPTIKSFLKIPGNYDLAIKGNTLYADSYIDLVVLDITDLSAIHEVERLENIFSSYNSLGFYADVNRGLVTEWVEEKNVTIYKSECNAEVQSWGGMLYEGGIAMRAESVFDMSAAIAPGNGSGPGVGGSMARFTINENADHLYTLDGGYVKAIDITNASDPQVKSSTQISWDMETIFPYKTNLFIGSQAGMHILDISTPEAPTKISTYEHIRVCDPVVVQGDLAYVTLRSGTQCQGFTNQLEVIDIKDLKAPQLLNTYAMHNPHGLGIDNTTLFICDGDAGLKVYDAADINTIDKNQLAHYDKINAFDVIPFNNVLMMIGEDGIFQYDYSDPKHIHLLSKISIVNAN